MPDYLETVIYKISCKNKKIEDIYIGSTVSFSVRKRLHKKMCISGGSTQPKLHDYINSNGGWYNWQMEIIENFPCENNKQKLEREQFWINQLKPSLNSTDCYDSEESRKRKKKEHREKPEVKEREKQKSKEWRENNKEKRKELKDAWDKKNKEHVAEYREHYKEIAQKRYEENKEEINKKRRVQYALKKELEYYNL